MDYGPRQIKLYKLDKNLKILVKYKSFIYRGPQSIVHLTVVQAVLLFQ